MVTPILAQTIPSISYSQTSYSIGKNRTATISSPNNSGGVIPSGYFNEVTTYTGSIGVSGATNGTLAQATFSNPYGMVFLASGDMLIADSANHVIRKITPQGVVSTFAGTAGGSGATNGTLTAAKFNGPSDIVQDNSGTIYVSETGNNLIRKITTAGIVSTLAGTGTSGSTNGTGTAASFNSPRQLAVDGSGNVYVTDYGNHLIRKITPAGVVTTLAGTAGVSGATDGTGTAAKFNAPFGIAVDSNNNVLVSDYNNSTIRKITPAAVVTTIAGAAGVIGDTDGSGLTARFDHPIGIVVDGSNNLYVIDKNNRLVRKITATGIVSTIAGTAGVQSSTNGIGTAATFNDLRGIALDAEGAIYVSDVTDQLIRKIQQVGYGISPALPAGLTLNTDGSISGTPTVGQGAQAYTLTATNAYGSSTSTITIAVIAEPIISYATPKVFGTGSAISPLQVVNTGGAIPAGLSGMVSTFAGSGTSGSTDGVGTAASFYYPSGIAMDASGNSYIADSFNGKIRKISPAGDVTTLAGSGTYTFADGTGTAASFRKPNGVTVDASGNVYVADTFNHRIRKISPAGVVTTLAGSGTIGSTDGTGTAASFNYPYGATVDA
ncbi:MAG: hypothetical protein KA133_01645 [Flavobacterium sp.]|nr:hypothetical protein [Flavobacterium sp.]